MKDEQTRVVVTTEELGERIIALLIIVEAVSVYLLWTLDSLTWQGQDAFALYLTINFIAFAMMSYVYRTLNSGGEISKVLVISGSLVIAIILFVSLTLAS